MKAAVSIVLTGMVVMAPLQQVLAQAAQQEAVTAQPSASPDGAAYLLRVPPPTQNTALLFWAASERSLVSEFLAPPVTSPVDALLRTPKLGPAVPLNPRVDERTPMPISTAGAVAIIATGIVVLLGVILFVSVDEIGGVAY